MSRTPPSMKVISVNLGLPRTVQWKGKAVSTAIFKTPVSDRITLRFLNLDGDRQADLSVHGGQNKAVYAYPAEHYAFWHHEFPDLALPWGMFGENLTTEGLREDTVQVGDRFRIGSAEAAVTAPRMPCFKLGLRFGRDDIVRRFLASGHTGFYFRVITEGEAQAGDPIVLVERAADSVTVSEITRLYALDKGDLNGLRRITAVGALPGDWRDYFKERISQFAARAPQRPARAPSWAGFRTFILRKKVRESDNASSFYFGPEDGQPLPAYLPGQFLTVRLYIPATGLPAVRSYSLSDAPRTDHYRLTIKRMATRAKEPHSAPGLVSAYFHDQLSEGDRIEAKAPAGTFTLDVKQHAQPVALIGGGVGITPLLSMLNSIAAAGSPRETWLLYGVRDHSEHIMRAHLETIARVHPNVHLHVFYSRPAGEIDGRGIHIGRIDLEAIQRLIPTHASDFYVCGPPAMMDSITRGLEAWGVPADRVHMEAFGPSTIKQAGHKPAAQPCCGVNVTFARSGVTALWSRCESPLIELAEEHSVAINFGCRAGSCGTCATQLLSGTVRYLHQPDAPLCAGEVLPCIAVPAEPLVLDV